MLLQAQGNGDSPAGHRLQRLCTELVSHASKCCCMPVSNVSAQQCPWCAALQSVDSVCERMLLHSAV